VKIIKNRITFYNDIIANEFCYRSVIIEMIPSKVYVDREDQYKRRGD